jgi:hypothetical protein
MSDTNQQKNLIENQNEVSTVKVNNLVGQKPVLKLSRENIGSVAVLIRGCTPQACPPRTGGGAKF